MIFVVTGMHRSGTSMVAGLLHHNGVTMGAQFRRPLPENPKGFYEEEAFRCFNDELLNEGGYRVKDWKPEFNGVRASPNSHAIAASLIERFSQTSDAWGWKDPRTCLTLGVWLNAIDTVQLLGNTKIILIRRQMRSVSRSLYRRGNIASLSQGAKLYRMYYAHLERGLRGYGPGLPVLRLRYERLLLGLDLDRLEAFCGLGLKRKCIDPSLDHSGQRIRERSGTGNSDRPEERILRDGGERALHHSYKDLARIKFALRRVADRQYGLCTNCEVPIDVERLQVIPETPFCADCARIIEAN